MKWNCGRKNYLKKNSIHIKDMQIGLESCDRVTNKMIDRIK